MPSCVFRKCTNYDAKVNKQHGISYHVFPSDKPRLQIWVEVVRKQRHEMDWNPTKHSSICSDHFKSEDRYLTKSGRTQLKRNAVPFTEVYECCDSLSSLNNVSIPNMDAVLKKRRTTLRKTRMHRLAIQKKLLQKRNKILIERNRRQSKKFATIVEILDQLRKLNYISEDHFAELNTRTDVLDLINRMHFKETPMTSKCKIYPPAFRKFALTLNLYSSDAYKYVRRMFHTALPHPRMLAKWYRNISFSPGFTQQAFDILKKKSSLSEKHILCNLIAKEMPLRHETMWTGKKTDGLVDFGIESNTRHEIATQVYVFILVSLDENWKIPVGYFFVKSVSANIRANLINTCLSKSYHAGADVIAVTFDSCSSNLATASILGCNLSKTNNLNTTFQHPECNIKVALFLDPCHLIKLVRNTFESKKVIFKSDKQVIRWQLIVALNELQNNQGLNIAQKCLEKDITIKNELMKVKLATQLLGRSLARALELCNKLTISTTIKDTQPTVEFISIFNDLFDIFNSRDSGQRDFKQPISSRNAAEFYEFVDKAEKYILSLYIRNKTKRVIGRGRTIINITKTPIVECEYKTGFLGFLICIQSIKHLYITYVKGETKLLKYIAPYKLNQNHLEIYFGIVHGQDGYKNNPNVMQFKELYKKIIYHLELRSSSIGNCIPLEYIPVLTCSSSDVVNINYSSGLRAVDTDENALDVPTCNIISQNIINKLANMFNNECFIDSAKQTIGYISSWLAINLVKIIKCEICVDELYTNKRMWFHKFISIRNMSGICYSSQNLFMVCLKSEAVLKSFIKEKGVYFIKHKDIETVKNQILKSFQHSNVFESLIEHSHHQPPAFSHRIHLIKAIIDKYVTIRIQCAKKIAQNSIKMV